MADKIIPPGTWKDSSYSRRVKSRSRSGPTSFHDRRLNPVGKHGYGRDTRKKGSMFGEYTSIEQYRKSDGRLIRKHRRKVR